MVQSKTLVPSFILCCSAILARGAPDDSDAAPTTITARDLQFMDPPPPDDDVPGFDDDAEDDDIDFGFDDDFAIQQVESGDYDFSCCFNIAEIFYEAPDFEFLSKALDLTDLDIIVAGPGPFTMFAPTDEAFYDFIEKAPYFATNLFEDQWVEHLLALLLLHVVVDEELEASDFFPGQQLPTADDETVFVDVTNDGEVIQLTPAVTGDYAEVILADVRASSGIIHVIDSLLQPAFFSQSILDRGMMEDYTFFFAAKLVGIDDIYDSPSPLTVFVPEDDAFDEAFTDEETDFLLSPEGLPVLQYILEFHTVEDVWPEEIFPEGEFVYLDPVSESFFRRRRRLQVGIIPPAFAPDILTVLVDDITFSVNEADVEQSGLLANNGIIHIINRVLMPPSLAGVDLTGRTPLPPPFAPEPAPLPPLPEPPILPPPPPQRPLPPLPPQPIPQPMGMGFGMMKMGMKMGMGMKKYYYYGFGGMRRFRN